MRQVEGGSWLERRPPYGYWEGLQTWETSAASAVSDANSRWGQVYPNFAGGDPVPICNRVRIEYHPDEIKSDATIYFYYGVGRNGRSQARQAGKFRLQTRSVAQWRELLQEPEGDLRVIQGDAGLPDDEYVFGQFYRVVRGDPRIHDFYSTLAVQTAYAASSFQLAPILGLRGCVNNASLSIERFGTAAAESLLLLDLTTDQQWGDDLVALDYLLAWSGPDETWNEKLRVQLYDNYVRKVRVFDEADAETEIMRQVTRQAPTEGIGTEPRAIFRKKSFSVLSGLTHW